MTTFSKDFIWGAATASYQVEGAAFEDGKGLNIWDVFTKEEESHVFDMHNGDTACDQYHRIEEDIEIMKKIGIKAYRFSVSWARIIPDGKGEINPLGFAYYDKLVDLLLEAGIEPYMTLYHWDLPFELQKRGGWINPDMPEWFENYSRVLAEHFKGRVKNYFTINEMHCVMSLGYFTREQAPGWVVSKREFFCIWKNLMLAHGKAVNAIREICGSKVKVGFATCGTVCYPTDRGVKENGFTALDSLGKNVLPEDVEAAKKYTFEIIDDVFEHLRFNLGLFTEPLCLGKLPEGLVKYYGEHLPEFTEEELKLVSTPVDFFGLNIYSGKECQAGEGGPEEIRYPDGTPKTMMLWNVTPDCLYWGPKFLHERYGKSIIITENGMAGTDWVSVDGKVHDGARIDFIHRYLRSYKKAAAEGVDAAGYFQWSLMDNFEWYFGYSKRFGIVHVDYQTQVRTLKDSAYFYSDVIKTNGEII